MDLVAQLRRDEGCVAHAYQDSRGFWTIGVGHLIDKRMGGSIPPHIIDALLAWDIERATAGLAAFLPWTAGLDEVRRGALVNMVFNLGIDGVQNGHGLDEFKNTLALIKAGDYTAAEVAMLKSKWATQVGPRATRLARQVRTGNWQ